MNAHPESLALVIPTPPAARQAGAPQEPASLRLPCVEVVGVQPGSPLGLALAQALADSARIVAHGQEPGRQWRRRRSVRGSALDWFGAPVEATAEVADLPDLVLDLHGSEGRTGVRTWRIVDALGKPVLRPFSGMAAGPGLPPITSLHLIEAAQDGAAWMTLA